jgi:hypothetical protein
MRNLIDIQRLQKFRVFYNTTIYPELQRLERHRRRLIRMFVLSGLFGIGLIVFEVMLGIWVVTLTLSIPVVIYIFYLFRRVSQYRAQFKPRVMKHILDFIEEEPNVQELDYKADGGITKEEFLGSYLFHTPAQYYVAEDYIYGKVGEMPFRMCELFVREQSKVRNRLDYVFKGIFLHATFPEKARGEIVIWPRELRQYLTRSIKEFTWVGGENVDHEVLNLDFKEAFITYATPDTHVIGILSEPMQKALVEYRAETGKEIYMSFLGREIYVAITEPKDIFEPYIFRSNVRFELVREFFEDIHMLLGIVQDFDQTH